MEDEAAALREMQTKVEQEMGDVQDPSAAVANQTNREVDARSIFVGLTSFGSQRDTHILKFLEPEAVEQALLLNESKLHSRQLKVSAKRTIVPRISYSDLGVPIPIWAIDLGLRSCLLLSYNSSYGYGKVPRFRMPMIPKFAKHRPPGVCSRMVHAFLVFLHDAIVNGNMALQETH
ncbi:hypothetical protein ACS0TY_033839 [Phlomoides rotata]